MELSELLDRCREGDQLAWEALVRQYQSRVFRVAIHYMRDEEEARDAAQEAFVRVYRNLHGFRGEERFLPWLLRIGRNVCIDRRRRIKARPEHAGVGLEDTGELLDSRISPEAASMEDSRRRLVHRALVQLSEPHREVILLKEIQGLSIEEIASMLGVAEGTVKSRSNRARIELARAVLELDPSAASAR
ncbi:MAG TPA: sigma-70 family RNA polymerase sigma factor [Candidatus Polarisedimenticolia bacterium]|nr:sigma-70 family RNA polymerase sigma factor [Candidatus Polarisedimenticolia bacterium]